MTALRPIRSRGRAGWATVALAAAMSGAALWLAWAPSVRPAARPAFPFPCIGASLLALHVHPLVRITVDGRPVAIPAGIGTADPVVSRGIVVGAACFQPIHTHDASGIIHIESPTVRSYTLADLIAVWRATYSTVTIQGRPRPVVWTPQSFLGLPLDRSHRLALRVDGRLSTGGPGLDLTVLDYCDAATAHVPPCWPTAQGGPWPLSRAARYGTQHTVVLDYEAEAAGAPAMRRTTTTRSDTR